VGGWVGVRVYTHKHTMTIVEAEEASKVAHAVQKYHSSYTNTNLDANTNTLLNLQVEYDDWSIGMESCACCGKIWLNLYLY
jgi:hypothetical protein